MTRASSSACTLRSSTTGLTCRRCALRAATTFACLNLSARLKTLEASLDRASEAASSHGKACRALLLAQAPVMAAVEHARRMRGGGAGGRVLT